jgi:hypothetical protein
MKLEPKQITRMSRRRNPRIKGGDMLLAEFGGKWVRISTATWIRAIDAGVPWDHTGEWAGERVAGARGKPPKI